MRRRSRFLNLSTPWPITDKESVPTRPRSPTDWDTNDLAYLCALADSGSYLGMDLFGLDLLLSFEQRVNTVAELAELGYAEKVVLATMPRVSATGSRKGNGPLRLPTGTAPT
jgi:hypothetical protein